MLQVGLGLVVLELAVIGISVALHLQHANAHMLRSWSVNSQNYRPHSGLVHVEADTTKQNKIFLKLKACSTLKQAITKFSEFKKLC